MEPCKIHQLFYILTKPFCRITPLILHRNSKRKGSEKMDIQDTIKRCQCGEKEAFQELFKSIEKQALATAYLISGNRGIAEDILQEAYIKSFKEIKKLKNPQVFKIWFYRILVRTGWEMSKKQSSLIPMDFTAERIL
jgi:hypothetical protein